MTNAEKFEQLFGLYATELWSKSEKDFLTWLNMEYVPDTNGVELISIQDAIEEIARHDTTDGTVKVFSGREVIEMLNNLPSTNAQDINAVDTISRQAAIDAICEHGTDLERRGITVLSVANHKQVTVDLLEKLPSVQPNLQPTCNQLATDLISRQAAIDVEGIDEQIRCEMCRNPMHTDRGCDGNCKYDEKLYERIMQILGERIKPLPEPRKGKWIYGEHDVAMCDGYRCDKCGFFVPWDYQHRFIDFIKDYNYCPSCGADMEVKND